MDINIVSRQEFMDRCPLNANPVTSFLAVTDTENYGHRFYIATADSGQLNTRTDFSIKYVDSLLQRLEQPENASSLPNFAGFSQRGFLFQAEDCPDNFASVSWERRRDWTAITLVPDLYYFLEGGYTHFMPEACPAWSERSSTLIWRGATTGFITLTPDRIDDLPRYQLVRAARALGETADAGFSDIVQAVSPEAHETIRQRFMAEGAIKPFIPFETMAAHKFIADVDGNANSWNFFKKLRLGGCVLKLDGPWRQWFSQRLIEWLHYVPVASDASDLADKLDWCRSHDNAAREIAENGRQFALEMDFEAEMRTAARAAMAASSPIDPVSGWITG